MPAVVGMIYEDVMSGTLACWTNVKGIAPDGHDVENNTTNADFDATFRITALTPSAGTLTLRAAPVTIQLTPINPVTAPKAFHPCDWVTASEAAKIMSVSSVNTLPLGDETGSQNPSCDYNFGNGLLMAQLYLPAALPIDAQTTFKVWSEPNYGVTKSDWRDVAGLPGPAKCIPDRLIVMLVGNRLLNLSNTGSGSSCEMLKQFAQTAIPRLPTS